MWKHGVLGRPLGSWPLGVICLSSFSFFFSLSFSLFPERSLRVRVEQWAPLIRAAGPGDGGHLSLFIQFFFFLFFFFLPKRSLGVRVEQWASLIRAARPGDGGSTG